MVGGESSFSSRARMRIPKLLIFAKSEISWAKEEKFSISIRAQIYADDEEEDKANFYAFNVRSSSLNYNDGKRSTVECVKTGLLCILSN